MRLAVRYNVPMKIGSVQFPIDDLREICLRFGVMRLSLFGSALTGENRPDSDVDLLVELRPDRVLSFFEFARLAREIETVLKKRVDLREPDDLSILFRDRVKREARLVLAA